MSWLLRKKKRARDMQLDEVTEKVDNLEERVNTITEVLIRKIDDPWAQGVLRSIYNK